MTYTIPITLDLGPAHTGKTVYAQLKNESLTNVGAAITSGITEIGSSGMFGALLTVPDDHSGYVVFYFSTDSAEAPCCPPLGISPEDKEMVTAINTAIAALNDLSAAQVNAECDSALADAGVTSALMTNLLNLFKMFGYPTDLNMATGFLTVFDTDGETPLFTMDVTSTGVGATLHQTKGLLTAV